MNTQDTLQMSKVHELHDVWLDCCGTEENGVSNFLEWTTCQRRADKKNSVGTFYSIVAYDDM